MQKSCRILGGDRELEFSRRPLAILQDQTIAREAGAVDGTDLQSFHFKAAQAGSKVESNPVGDNAIQRQAVDSNGDAPFIALR